MTHKNKIKNLIVRLVQEVLKEELADPNDFNTDASKKDTPVELYGYTKTYKTMRFRNSEEYQKFKERNSKLKNEDPKKFFAASKK